MDEISLFADLVGSSPWGIASVVAFFMITSVLRVWAAVKAHMDGQRTRRELIAATDRKNAQDAEIMYRLMSMIEDQLAKQSAPKHVPIFMPKKEGQE